MSHASAPVSVVVPVLDEEDSVVPLITAVREALEGLDWELVVVDDGSTDRTRDRVRAASAGDGRVRLVSLARRYGQATAMQAGFDHAKAPVVVTMDGDLQNDPRDIPRLLRTLNEGYDLVAGYRVRRKDRLILRRLPSWTANRLIRLVTGVPIRDNGCSLKAYRRELLDRMRLYSDMHRFVPALAAGTAGASIAEVPVRHHHRTRGTSKYGLSRVAKVLADLFTVVMIRSFRARPLLLFSYAAAAAVAAALALFGTHLALLLSPGTSGSSLVVYPAVAVLALATGVYLVMLGLLAEVVIPRGGSPGRALPRLVREGGVGEEGR